MATYKSKVVDIIDGDTVDVDIDTELGIIFKEQRIRFVGVDTHEISFVSHDSDEYKKGMEEKEFVEDWIDENSNSDGELYVTISDGEKGSYERWLGIIKKRRLDGWDESLNKAILDNFDGVEYGG